MATNILLEQIQRIEIGSLPSVPLGRLDMLPSISAIYFAVDGQGEVQYVGQSKNIFSRWTQHYQHGFLYHMEGVRIYFLPCHFQFLDLFEPAFIWLYSPSLNKGRKAPASERSRRVIPSIVQTWAVEWDIDFFLEKTGMTVKEAAKKATIPQKDLVAGLISKKDTKKLLLGTGFSVLFLSCLNEYSLAPTLIDWRIPKDDEKAFFKNITPPIFTGNIPERFQPNEPTTLRWISGFMKKYLNRGAVFWQIDQSPIFLPSCKSSENHRIQSAINSYDEDNEIVLVSASKEFEFLDVEVFNRKTMPNLLASEEHPLRFLQRMHERSLSKWRSSSWSYMRMFESYTGVDNTPRRKNKKQEKERKAAKAKRAAKLAS